VRSWLALLVLGSACTVLVPPAPPPPGSPSARLLTTEPYEVGSREYTFVRGSRATLGHEGEGPPRTLVTTVWFPRAAEGPHPLVVYSHGFLSNRRGGTYLAEYLAGRGYVVAAADHPRTRRWAPGGPVIDDVVNQPADLSALIDRILAWDERERPFPGAVDPERVGVVGLSLGGMTVTLAAFHPELRDPRVKAAVSIAGPMSVFAPSFFAGAPVAFLMVAGDGDVVVDYATNAPLVLERVPGGELVTIAGASHAGFDDVASGVLRVLPNLDAVACWWMARTVDLDRSGMTLAALGGPGAGVLLPASMPRPCRQAPPCRMLDPARQQLATELAVGAFFDSRLASDEGARAAAAAYLRRDLARDLPEVRHAVACTPPCACRAGPP
jgi:dienelactone hydrolase